MPLKVRTQDLSQNIIKIQHYALSTCHVRVCVITTMS